MMGRFACLTLLLFQITPAWAVLIAMEPDAFPAGTDVSNAWAQHGISIRRSVKTVGVEAEYRPATTSNNPNFAVTGTAVFGGVTDLYESVPCMTEGWCNAASRYWNVLRLDFTRTVDFVEIFAAFSSDPVMFYALNANNEVIGSSGPLTELWRGTTSYSPHYISTSFSSPNESIAAIIIGAPGGAVGYVDTIRVNVPEPGTLALFSLGLVGIAIRRKRLSWQGSA